MGNFRLACFTLHEPVEGANSARAKVGLVVNKVKPGYQQVADQLLELILAGTIVAGERLPSEAELSTTFGVSRSTVREGLRVLTSRDIIHTTRGASGGTFVNRVDMNQYSDYLETSIGLLSGDNQVTVENMLEARELIEVPAARLAAERQDAQSISALREAIEFETDPLNRGGQFKDRRSFHGLILVAAGNSLLGTMSEPVFRVLQAQFLENDLSAEFWERVDHDHEDILACIEAGDVLGAERAMREHIVRLRDAYGVNAYQ